MGISGAIVFRPRLRVGKDYSGNGPSAVWLCIGVMFFMPFLVKQQKNVSFRLVQACIGVRIILPRLWRSYGSRFYDDSDSFIVAVVDIRIIS